MSLYLRLSIKGGDSVFKGSLVRSYNVFIFDV